MRLYTRVDRFVCAPMILAVGALCLGLSGCAAVKKSLRRDPPAARQEVAATADPTSSPELHAECREDNERERDRCERLELELQVSAMRLRELESRDQAQREMLDEAVLEVVRAKAKLQTLESKAEAAASLAEVEVALKRADSEPARAGSAGLEQARAYLRMASEEFQRGNFGGALYLTSQAKTQIRTAQHPSTSTGFGNRYEGEELFANFRHLLTMKNSNVRGGPGLEFDVIRTLARGTAVIGYSRAGEWVRVVYSGGESGWVHKPLLAER